MATLTETIVDVADRHTTLYHLGVKPPSATSLPFRNEKAYVALHKKLISPKRTEYRDIAKRGPGAILGRLAPGYGNYKYWHRTLKSRSYEQYPAKAWDHLLPVEALLTRRVLYVPDSGFAFKVSPRPQVLLYPFGWSTWVSLRILGKHTLEDLAGFVDRLFARSNFRFEGDASSLALHQVLDKVADGVREDAFGGEDTQDSDTSNTLVVATVLAKYGGSPALGALSTEEKAQLRRIVRPSGPPPGSPFQDHVYRLMPDTDLEYMIHDSHGRFLWVEHLLDPTGRNHEDLRCYHNNTFISLLQAWHLHGFLDAAVLHRSLSNTVFQLAQAAKGWLESPGYTCASLVQFLASPELNASLQKAAALKAPQRRPRK